MSRNGTLLLTVVTAAVNAVSSSAVQASAQEETQEVVLGRSSTIRPPVAPSPTIVLPAGTRLRNAPGRDAAVLEILTTTVELPVLATRDGWSQVELGSLRGWVEVAPRAGGERPIVANPVEPSSSRIARAGEILGVTAASDRLGPFALITDVDDDGLLDWLSQLAFDVVRVFQQRYGLDPGDRSPEAVVLFAREEPYRMFQREEPGWAEMHTQGFSNQGLAVLYVGQQERLDIGSILVHELTHLLNRRVFTAAPPAWLDEGLAEDLAYCRIDGDGHLVVGSLGGDRATGATGEWSLAGGRAHLAMLLDRWNSPDRPPLWRLTDLDRTEFLQIGNRSLLYAESAFLIRSLLDRPDRDLEGRFRAFLEQVAGSELSQTVSLWETMAIDPDVYEQQLYRFLDHQARANDLPDLDKL